METKFNFKSQIATSREQSEKLLALGLKKETADMVYKPHYVNNILKDYYRPKVLDKIVLEYMLTDDSFKDYIPAWSLHRLIEMMPESIHLDSFANTHYDRTLLPSKIIYMKYDHTWIWLSDKQNDYDKCVDTIAWLIKEGYFNKEYLV